MDAKRITELYDLVRGIPDELLDMDTFGELNDCGSPACMAGWAARHGPFAEAGLSPGDRQTGSIAFGGRQRYGALAAFFEMSYEQAQEVFGPTGAARDDDAFIIEIEELETVHYAEKALALARLLNLMLGEGAITEARHRELWARDCEPSARNGHFAWSWARGL